MKAAVLSHLNKPLEIAERLEHGPLRKGQVRVEIAYSGVCRSQLMEARGFRGVDRYLPHLLGHEATGIVRELGQGVTKVHIGQKVVLGWIKGEGIEAGPTHYVDADQTRTINAGPIHTFNSEGIFSENRCFPLPEGIPMDVGVLFGCALLTGAGIVFNQIKLARGDSVSLWGLGGVGLAALVALRTLSEVEIYVIEKEEERLELARRMGVPNKNCILATGHDAVPLLLALRQGRGTDAAIEATGTTEGIEAAFSGVRPAGGHCVFASHPPTGQKISIDPHELISGKRIEGSWGGAAQPDRDIPRLAELYVRGLLPLEAFFQKRYRLEEINTALNDMESGRTLRPLLEINPQLGISL